MLYLTKLEHTHQLAEQYELRLRTLFSLSHTSRSASTRRRTRWSLICVGSDSNIRPLHSARFLILGAMEINSQQRPSPMLITVPSLFPLLRFVSPQTLRPRGDELPWCARLSQDVTRHDNAILVQTSAKSDSDGGSVSTHLAFPAYPSCRRRPSSLETVSHNRQETYVYHLSRGLRSERAR